MSSLVSVIVPCFNLAQFLPEALQSVLDQSYMNWECIIINDDSSDNTEEVALNWKKKDDRFIYLKKENEGVSAARNYGINFSKGKYILPLDADDLIGSTYIEKAVRVLENNSAIGIVYCNASYFGNKKGHWILPKHSTQQSLILNTIFCTALFRRTDFNRTNGYNTNMKEGYEDWDFWLYFIEQGIKVHQIPENLFFYRIRSNSRNSSIDFIKLINLHKQIIQNHLELYHKHFKNPYIIVDYLEFRKGLSGGIAKTAMYIFKNLSLKVFIFIIRYKLNLIFRLKAAIFQ